MHSGLHSRRHHRGQTALPGLPKPAEPQAAGLPKPAEPQAAGLPKPAEPQAAGPEAAP
jgi:hypothetical protein